MGEGVRGVRWGGVGCVGGGGWGVQFKEVNEQVCKQMVALAGKYVAVDPRQRLKYFIHI